jgi:hypothetical protein
MTVSLKRQKFNEKVAESLNLKFRRVLEQMGGDIVVRNMIKSSPSKALSIMASLEPKNVHVQQEHRINFVQTPKKEALPEGLDENIIDITPIPNC